MQNNHSGFWFLLRQGKIGQHWRTHRLFWATVVIPTLASVLYFGLIASDVYVSESRFVVRSPEKQTASPLGVLLKGSGFSRSEDDSYTVQSLILSRDALLVLDKQLNMRKLFGKGDVINRFPQLGFDDSFEALYQYYQNRITAGMDSASSIITLKTRAAAALDAQNVNKILLEMSEELVNRLNERGRQDMIRFVLKEVEEAEQKAKQAALDLANYRNQKGVIDPERQSAVSLQQIAKLQDELIISKAQLEQLQTLTKENPQIPVLAKRIQSLERSIVAETNRMAGGESSLASKAAEYQRLVLERELADKQLATALMSLENARNEARRQQLYLERIAQPSLPDEALEPKRLKNILAVFILGLVFWGVLSMLIAGIKEHQD